MVTRITCLAGWLASAVPLVGAAQNTAPVAKLPQLYVGLGGSILTRGDFPGFTGFEGRTIVPTFTAGVQLLPRLAVQAGAGYRWDTRHYAFGGRQLDGNGQSQPGNWRETRSDSYLNAPILARYTVTRNLDRRLAIDVLGGATIRRYSSGYSASFVFDQTQAAGPVSYSSDGAATDVYASLGPSVRYRVGTHLDLTGDVVVDYLTGRYYGASSGRFSGNLMLGVRYRFGGR